jgi:type II secretory pathway pseudopilin PulG
MAILGITLTLGLSGIVSGLKRQRLATASSEVNTLVTKVYSTMQAENEQTFLVFGKYVANRGTDVAVVVDRTVNGVCDEAIDPNNDGLFDDAPTNLVPWRYRIPADIALSNAAANGQTFNAPWRRPATGSISAVILCDFMGRAMTPPEAVGGTRAVVNTPATVTLTHADMISGKLTPQVTYTVSIAPLFRSTLRRVP